MLCQMYLVIAIIFPVLAFATNVHCTFETLDVGDYVCVGDYVYVTVHLSFCLLVCLCVCIRPSIYLYVCMSVCERLGGWLASWK